MEKGTFTIALADGTSIGGLGLNGHNFVSQSEVTPEMFAGKLGHVTITGPEDADAAGLLGEHEHMELIQIAHYDDGWYFVLRDIPAEKLEKLKLRGDIAYIAMMAGIEL